MVNEKPEQMHRYRTEKKSGLEGEVFIFPVVYLITSNLSFDFEKILGYWSWYSEETGGLLLTNLRDADTHREGGLDGRHYEEFSFLKNSQFLDLGLERNDSVFFWERNGKEIDSFLVGPKIQAAKKVMVFHWN